MYDSYALPHWGLARWLEWRLTSDAGVPWGPPAWGPRGPGELERVAVKKVVSPVTQGLLPVRDALPEASLYRGLTLHNIQCV